MKKFYLLALLLPVVLISCSKNDPPGPGGEGGSIVLKPEVIPGVESATRVTSTDYATYSLLIEDPEGDVRVINYPSDNTIKNLDAGIYKVTLTSHLTDFTKPAFEEPVYTGTASATVNDSSAAELDLPCYQTNSGVYFTYDSSLADAKLQDIIPTVTQSAGSLTYKDGDRTRVGYFVPDDAATLSFTLNGEEVEYEGVPGNTLQLKGRTIYKVNLTGEFRGGSIYIIAEVEEIDVTDELTIALLPVPGTMLIRIEGYEGENITLNLKTESGTPSINATVTSSGNVFLSNPADAETYADALLVSITHATHGTIHVGRQLNSTVRIKTEGGRIVHRDADEEGYIPVGTVSEFLMIEDDVNGSYRAEGNIDFAGYGVFEGICKTTPFKGKWRATQTTHFKNIEIASTSDYTGLFCQNEGEIYTLHVLGGSITGVNYVGLIGRSISSATQVDVSFQDATVTGETYVGINFGQCIGNINATGSHQSSEVIVNSNNGKYIGTVAGELTGDMGPSNIYGKVTINGYAEYVGGTAGYSEGLTVRQCLIQGDVYGNAKYVGGMIGHLEGDFSVSMSGFVSSVPTGQNFEYVGGYIGYISNSTITDFNAEGPYMGGGFTSDTEYTGGVIGCVGPNVNLSGLTFSGTVNGTNHVGGIAGFVEPNAVIDGATVTGKVNGTDFVGGIIGELGANQTVKNCTVNANVKGANYVGGITGRNLGTIEYSKSRGTSNDNRSEITATGQYAGGIAGYTTGTLTTNEFDIYANVTAAEYSGGIAGSIINGAGTGSRSTTSSSTINGGKYVGCLFGYAEGITLDYLTWDHTSARVEVTMGADYVGGVVGYGKNVVIEGAIRTSNVISNGKYTGGLIGYSEGCTLKDNSVYSQVTGKDYTGGFAGYIDAATIIEGIPTTPAVIGERYTGGIIGYNDGASFIGGSARSGRVTGTEYVGGFVGFHDGGTLEKLSNTGDVFADDIAGGIVGYNNGTVIAARWVQSSYTEDSQTVYRLVTGTNAGGLIGVNDGTLSAGYAVLIDNFDAGALVGTNNGTISDSYYTTTGAAPVLSGSAAGTIVFGDGTGGTGWPTDNSAVNWGVASSVSPGYYWSSLGDWNGGNPTYPTMLN